MDLPKFPLYVALTRPAINRAGIPQKAWTLIFGCSFLFAVVVGKGNLKYYTISVPFFIIVRLLTDWDHNWMRIGRQWIRTKLSVFRHGETLSPLPVGIPAKADDVAGIV